MKLYYTKALSDEASSLVLDWILLFQRPQIPASFHGSQTSFHLVLTVYSWHAHSFLRRQKRCCGIPISWRISHSLLWSTFRSSDIVNIAEVHAVFLKLSCLINDPKDVDNLIFSNPVAPAEFSKFAGTLSAEFWQYHGFRIWKSSTGINSLPLALFLVNLPQDHLTSAAIFLHISNSIL